VPTIVNLSLGFRLAIPFIAHKFKTASYYQGIGRHTRADATEMGFKDLRAVSVFLGELIHEVLNFKELHQQINQSKTFFYGRR